MLCLQQTNFNFFSDCQESGNFVIIGENETDIKWTAEPSTNESCLSKNLELNNNGELLLKCESGETKWSK